MAIPAEKVAGAGVERDRPRFFDKKAKNICWSKAAIVPGRHPDRWRKDAAGNVVCKRFCNCSGCLCFEYDHVVPFSKATLRDKPISVSVLVDNDIYLQGGESTSDNCQILQTRVNRYKSDKVFDPSILRGYSCDLKFSDKELDVIEMAVYGDVIRPGNQCKCRTVAEMLGNFKAKDQMKACKLPNQDGNLGA
ncbi:hypothetical protein V2J09_016901 [Rumex salicifolius]